MRSFFPIFVPFFTVFFLWHSPLLASEKVQDLRKEVQEEFQRHNYKKVIQLYRDFTSANPELFPSLIVKALYSQSLADTGEIDQAIDVLKEILADFPPQLDPLRLQYDLANLLFMQRQYEEARAAYQKVLLQASRNDEIRMKARDRIALMKQSEGRKKDILSLQLLEIETSLESNEVPEGAEGVLNELLAKNPEGPQADRARKLLDRIREVRIGKAAALLGEARRLFDQERKYNEVRQILEQMVKDYSDVADMQSAQLLLKEANRRLGVSTSLQTP